ncbi:CinA family protein [Glutamicibacter uratoxydans]|uniref:CinA family protein n=1 Tax=Glutamicibacter uratoxydans TaxID=43667 RepID=UPI003D6F2DBC
MPQDIANKVIQRAVQANMQLATAESLTAGQISAALATVAGASAVLRGGVVSYSSEVKHQLLGVSAELLQRKGSVDPEVAAAMARGAREVCGADLAVSATGVAGPSAHDGKSVGTVFIGWATATQDGAIEHHFVGDREQIRARATQMALQQLLVILNQENSQQIS